jgi:hypothetical protein
VCIIFENLNGKLIHVARKVSSGLNDIQKMKSLGYNGAPETHYLSIHCITFSNEREPNAALTLLPSPLLLLTLCQSQLSQVQCILEQSPGWQGLCKFL